MGSHRSPRSRNLWQWLLYHQLSILLFFSYHEDGPDTHKYQDSRYKWNMFMHPPSICISWATWTCGRGLREWARGCWWRLCLLVYRFSLGRIHRLICWRNQSEYFFIDLRLSLCRGIWPSIAFIRIEARFRIWWFGQFWRIWCVHDLIVGCSVVGIFRSSQA